MLSTQPRNVNTKGETAVMESIRVLYILKKKKKKPKNVQ